MATSPFFFGTPKNSKVQIANADASNLKTIVTGAAGGTKVLGVVAASDDSSNRDVTLGISKSGTFYPLVTRTVPANAGTAAATASINMLALSRMVGLPVDSDGNPYILLESGDTLDAKALTTLTSGKLISLTAIHANA